MHKARLVVTVLILAALLGAAQVQARIIAVPSADVLPDGAIELSLFNHRGNTHLKGSVGMFNQLQADLGGVFSSEAHLRTALKLALVKEQTAVPGVALGMEITDSRLDFYGVLSKQLVSGIRGHLAFGSGRYSKGMVGLSYVLNPVQVNKNAPLLTLGVEYDGSGLNTGITAKFAPNFGAHIYLSDFQRLGAGLNYRFSF
ncbi:MAG: YjbH domain-containing protein [Firmicutes bacterium]|nr:YjbH domain-containing protein [Bacillota bacterium]